MKNICPKGGCLLEEATNPSCRNVQIFMMRSKCMAGAERVRGRYRQIDNMKHKYQLHMSN